MPFNGSGLFTRVYNWVADAANGINITASRVDTEDSGFATGLSNCITKDGQQVITADIPWNNHKITGLAPPVAGTDAANLNTVAGSFTTGTMTLTLTGCTTSPTTSGQYAVAGIASGIGTMAMIYIPALSATSNATTLSLTGLPSIIQPSHQIYVAVPDGGTINNGSAITVAGGHTAVIQLNPGNSAITFLLDTQNIWTNSGTKGVNLPIAICYQLFP
jgi:hypothetical protein